MENKPRFGVNFGFRRAASIGWLALCAGVLLALGCGPQADAPQTPTDQPKGDPVSILKGMVDAYQSCDGYHDDATVELQYRLRGEYHKETQPIGVAFSRPNKLKVNAYDVTIASNGEQMQVDLGEDARKNLDGQFVSRPAPGNITWPELGLEPATHEVIEEGFVRHPPQLELLIAQDPLARVFSDEMPKTLLESEKINGRDCWRVRASLNKSDDGFTFWIDRESNLLLRLEFPRTLVPQITSLPDVADITLIANFPHARFEARAGETYQLATPAGAKVVETFLLRPPRLPSELIGKQPLAPFVFTDLDGGKLKSTDLVNKTTALVWFNNIPAGKAAMERLNAVAAELKDPEKFSFYGVCVEPADVSNEQVREMVKSWGVSIPIVRDLTASSRDAFRIPVWPSLVLLAPAGVIQIFEPGDYTKMKEQLPDLMKQVASGEDIAAAQRRVVEEQQAIYRTHLGFKPVAGENEVVMEIPRIKVGPASAPDSFQLRELWSADEFAAPGKFISTKTKDGYRLFVLDGYRTVVELNDAGKEISRTELPLPEGVAVSELRTVTTASGKQRFGAFEILGKQFYVFDADWKLLFAYPDANQQHQGIRDALLADLDAEEDAEAYVGFWYPVGIHQVDMSGELHAADKQLTSVLSLDVSPANSLGWRKLLAAGSQGFLLRFNQFLKSDPPMRMKDAPLHQVAAATDSSSAGEEYLGVSFLDETKLRVIAFDQSLSEHWSFEWEMLPRPPIAKSVEVNRGPGWFADRKDTFWAIVMADGSVSLVRLDGLASDFFRVGEEIRHAELINDGNRRILVFSTPKRIVAQELLPPR